MADHHLACNLKQTELINEPRQFEVGELFFSTTDLKGRIQRANQVFCRIAGWSWTDMQNKPHNIIRHPEMPRVVFQLLWDGIQAGKPIVAYVKNLAHDGRYYWVVALVTPFSGGYLSVRFKPTSPLRETAALLYGELRSIEASIEDESHDRKAAIAASSRKLDTSLSELGFAGYDAFMRHAMKVEMQSREQLLGNSSHRTAHADESGTLDGLIAAAELFDSLAVTLRTIFSDLELYAGISQGVRLKSAIVADVSESLRVSALNGAIETDKLGAKAAGLRPVLDWLRSLSAEITQHGARFSDSLNELVGEVDLVVFDLSAAKLQIEMTATFVHEMIGLAASGRASELQSDAVTCLHASFCETVRRAITRLGSIRERLAGLTASQLRLIQSSHSLRPIYLTGRIELSAGVGVRLASVFEDVGTQLEQTTESLDGLGALLRELDSHLARGLKHGAEVESTIARIDSSITAI